MEHTPEQPHSPSTAATCCQPLCDDVHLSPRSPQAGENTLNAIVMRVVMRGMSAQGGYTTERFLQDYVTFMTTPGSHNDTYAESFHRCAPSARLLQLPQGRAP
jgi:hypothetical protein